MIRKINILLLTFISFTLINCTDDYLELKPTQAISATDALSSADNMDLILNGLHRVMYAQNPLPGGTSSRSGQSHYLPALDAMGGNIIHSAPGNGWGRTELQWQVHTLPTSTTVFNFWYQRYHFIFAANSIINTVAEGNLPSTPELDKVLGQAYAYRAWAYHQLIMTYAKGYLIGNPTSDKGVPIILEAGLPFDSAPRSPVEDVYNLIEDDLESAISFLDGAPGASNKSEISLNAVYGIKARVALSKGDWDTAAANAVLARDGYPLLNESDWLSGFNTVDLSEVIWGGVVIDTETNFFQSYFYYICPTFNGSQNRGNPKLVSIENYNMLPDTDYRKKAFLPNAPNTNSSASNDQGGSFSTDPNYDTEEEFDAAFDAIVEEYGITTAHNTHPYMHVKFLQKNPGTIDPDDVIYMRSSEMYLIEAEAKAMRNDITGAQNALAVLAEERDSGFDKTAFATQSEIMEQIKLQRRIELYGEGFSFHDQIRWDEGLDQSNSGASSVLYQDGFMQAKPSENDAWIWKIPQAEIDSNPNIGEADQN